MLWAVQVRNSDVHAEQYKIEFIDITNKRSVLSFCGRE